MLINNLNLNGRNINHVAEALNIKNMTEQEISLLISFAATTPNYAESFQEILQRAGNLCGTKTLDAMLNHASQAQKKFPKETNPSAADIITQILKHPNAGRSTLKAYHEALLPGISNALLEKAKPKTLLTKMREEPVLPQHETLAQQSYCLPVVSAHISINASHHQQTIIADRVANIAYEAAVNDRQLGRYSAEKATRIGMAATHSLQNSIDRTLTHLSGLPKMNLTPIYKIISLIAVLKQSDNHRSYSTLYKPVEHYTADELITGESGIQRLILKHADTLTGASELPAEYQTRIINMELAETVETMFCEPYRRQSGGA